MDKGFMLPPYRIKRVVLAASEIIDWGLDMLSIPLLWKQTKGKGIKVAVLDTGIDYKHPDLSSAILNLKDFTNSGTGPWDVDGHGTHVAGTIAARKDGRGVVGVAPEAKLLIGKVLGDNGYGSFKDTAAGIKWAIDQKADIISMSLGSAWYDQSVHEAIKAAVGSGIFVICAAGNSGDNLDTVEYPGKHPETVAVGAVDRSLEVTEYSSRGDQVDIAAPGDEILSTYPPQKYAVLSGTSMATPFVSGVVALMLAKHRQYGGDTPVENQEQLIQHLRKTAVDIGPHGPDPHSGFGLINPESLLDAKARRLLHLVSKEDLTPAGLKKLEVFTNGDRAVRPTRKNETYFEGNIRDGVGEIRGGIRIEL